jgi:hypothetical protein
MEAAAKVCQSHPELFHELQAVVEPLIESNSPAFGARWRLLNLKRKK